MVVISMVTPILNQPTLFSNPSPDSLTLTIENLEIYRQKSLVMILRMQVANNGSDFKWLLLYT